MTETPRTGERAGPEDAALEALVARCVEEGGGDPEAVVDLVCADEPALAGRVRARLSVLRRFGLVGAAEPERAVGGYRLLEELGAGGMGVVWLAEHLGTGRRVALKTADPRLPWTDRMRERFLREVRAASRLDHPHVVAIEDVGEDRGVPYFTMRVVDGATLRELLAAVRRGAGEPSLEGLASAWRQHVAGPDAAVPARWGPTYVSAVTRLALDVAEALAHAHGHGVVHRDVKPGNVLVDREGRAVLFDLGLAHLADDPGLTRTGDFAGSPHYASPEQVTGPPRAIDGRTDVYSLGVTLYESAALVPPFEAQATPALLRLIVQREAPPLRARSALVPRDLDTIVATCLEKDPGRRYASAQALAADLRRFLRLEPIAARPIGGARRLARRLRRNPAWAAAGLLAAGVAVAAPLGFWQYERGLRLSRDRAEGAAAEARREADENREVSAFLESLWIQLDESGDPAHAAVSRDLFELAVDRAERDADLAPSTRANLLVTLARVLHGTGRDAEAVPLLDRAFAHRQREHGERHPRTAEVLRQLAEVHLALGNAAEALALARRGESVYRDELAAHPRAADARLALARATRVAAEGAPGSGSAELQDAEALVRDALEQLERAGRGASPVAARAHRELGELALARGDFAGAVRVLEHGRALLTALTDPPLADLADTVLALGRARAAAGEPRRAVEEWRAALALFRKAGGDRSPRVAGVLRWLVPAERETLDPRDADAVRALAGHLHLSALGGGPAARAELAEAVRLLRPLADEAPAALGAALADLAAVTGDDVEARRLLEEARGLAGAGEGRSELWELEVLQALARGDAAPGALLREGVEVLRRRGPGLEGAWSDAALRHAELLLDAGRTAEVARVLGLLGTRADGAPAADVEAPFEDAFQAGITALQAGRPGAAAEAFRACLELRPDHPVAAYNLACALALAGRRDAALEALARAAEAGYAYRERGPELTREDADLASLHGDPRFDRVVARMEELRDRADAFASTPAAWLPADRAGPLPLLVVLHGPGETPGDVLAGPWRAAAERLGYALLAPSGRVPVGTVPEQGMRWAADLETYGQRSWYYERTVREAYQRFSEEHEVDGQRVFVAGEGLGGAVAFNVAVHAPELYRGVLLVDAPVHGGLAAEKAPHLGSMGLRVTLLADLPESAARTAETFALLRDWGIRASVGEWPGNGAGEDPEEALALVRAVRWLEGS